MSPPKIPSHTHTHTHSINTHPHQHTSHPQHHLSITIVAMPLKQAVVTYDAFREITNFIRDNGDDWGEFCHNTSHPLTTRKTVKTPPPSTRKVSHHKNAENKGTLAPEPSSSSPSNTMTSGGCIRRPKPPFGLLKKLISRAML